jgi:hypothetical protein
LIRASSLAALLALTPLGCEPAVAPENQLVAASREVSFGDIANLGPHRLEATIHRRTIVDGQQQSAGQDQVQLVWQDWDNFQLARRRSGEIISQVLVEGGSARLRKPDGTFVAVSDVEPHRVELRMAWDVWSLGLSVFEGMMAFEHQGESQLEGRAASEYRVHLAGEGPQRVGRVVADSLEGSLWIDEVSAVRLMAEVSGRWHRVGQEEVVHEVEMIFVRTDFGLPSSFGG